MTDLLQDDILSLRLETLDLRNQPGYGEPSYPTTPRLSDDPPPELTRRTFLKATLTGAATVGAAWAVNKYLDPLGLSGTTTLPGNPPPQLQAGKSGTGSNPSAPPTPDNTNFVEQPFYIGPDTSQFNGKVLNYGKLASQGVAFAFARIGYWNNTSGRTDDALFAKSRAAMHDAGLLPGYYYFYVHGDPKRQAKHCYETLMDTDPNHGQAGKNKLKGLLALDLEHAPTDNSDPTLREAQVWRNEMANYFPDHPIFTYTYTSYWNSKLGARDALPNSQLWWARPLPDKGNPYAIARKIAKPGTANDPYMSQQFRMKGYEAYLIRQYTFDGHLPGHKGRIDFNISFAKWAKLLEVARMDVSDVRTPTKLAAKP